MKKRTEYLAVVVVVLIAIGAGLGVFAWSGLYNIGADDPHWSLTLRIMQTVRDRSVHAHAKDIAVPGIDDPQLILKGAGQYAAMCTGCHLAPGMANSEIRPGLYPQPPVLWQTPVDPRDAFWTIKHGIKMSAMPAWGGSHDDDTIWSMVAFLQKLPDMTPQQYKDIVAKAPPDEDMDMDMGGAGHSHSHAHPEPAHDNAMESMLKAGAVPAAEAVAQSFQDALKQGDRENALALLSDNARINEGGESQTAAEYAAHHLGDDIAFLKGARIVLLSRTSMQMNDTAHVVSDSRIDATSEGKPLKLRSNERMELRRIGDTWKIVTITWTSQRLSE